MNICLKIERVLCSQDIFVDLKVAGKLLMKEISKTPIEKMPFYSSMMKVHSSANIDTRTLLWFQIGFNADPNSCKCGQHEWSIYDLMIEAVNLGGHDWAFFSDPKFAQEPKLFLSAIADLTCPECGNKSEDVRLRYNYGGYIYEAC